MTKRVIVSYVMVSSEEVVAQYEVRARDVILPRVGDLLNLRTENDTLTVKVNGVWHDIGHEGVSNEVGKLLVHEITVRCEDIR